MKLEWLFVEGACLLWKHLQRMQGAFSVLCLMKFLWSEISKIVRWKCCISRFFFCSFFSPERKNCCGGKGIKTKRILHLEHAGEEFEGTCGLKPLKNNQEKMALNLYLAAFFFSPIYSSFFFISEPTVLIQHGFLSNMNVFQGTQRTD